MEARHQATEGIQRSAIGEEGLESGHAPENVARYQAKLRLTWRSLLDARDLLVAGMRWEIRHGQTTLISGHPWLPRLMTFQLLARPKMMHQRRGCRPSLCQTIVHNEECVCVGGGNSFLSNDLVCWGGLAFYLEEQGLPQNSALRLEVWTHGPFNPQNLRRRGFTMEDQCVHCSSRSENLTHVLFTCTYAQLVGTFTCLRVVLLPQQADGGLGWLREAHRAMDAPDFALFLAIGWDLWHQRNRLIFEGVDLQAHEVVALANKQLVNPPPGLLHDPG
ncbi:hypothetical protein Salat_1889000 [Sesamum alatum]|uniref:Reverse transcriptase zinc-binding domain-containing protein n=1 Tax=Sesamum alatum TaxID=300844 RepID=A0AAE2CIC2_9LAMI|nr:hypothetical protein Salat_1889000 [Sesamum alatum]